jgi:hypothetical protein
MTLRIHDVHCGSSGDLLNVAIAGGGCSGVVGADLEIVWKVCEWPVHLPNARHAWARYVLLANV